VLAGTGRLSRTGGPGSNLPGEIFSCGIYSSGIFVFFKKSRNNRPGKFPDYANKFFPEKYFTIYLSERTEFFSHMTERPLFPESWSGSVYAAVALVLVAAMMMAAGCQQ
jgi:hypothetical protein